MSDNSRSAAPTGVGAKPWIKMRTDLWDDPRTSALCDALDADEARVIGGLYRLWSIADSHSTDGRLPWWSESMVDRKCGIAGFGKALQSVGWIIVDDNDVTIPDFEVHNGQSAKSRAQNSLRQQARRSRKIVETEVSRTKRDNDASGTRQRCGSGVTNKDELKEEKIKQEPPPHHSAESATTQTSGTDEWQEVVVLLGNAGLAAASQTARDARQRGYSKAQIIELCDELVKRPQLGPGALAWRIQNVAPNRPLYEGWPDSKPTTKPAPEIEIEKYKGTWSSLKRDPRLALARQAGIDLSRHAGTITEQSLDGMNAELRRPLVKLLAREAGGKPPASNT